MNYICDVEIWTLNKWILKIDWISFSFSLSLSSIHINELQTYSWKMEIIKTSPSICCEWNVIIIVGGGVGGDGGGAIKYTNLNENSSFLCEYVYVCMYGSVFKQIPFLFPFVWYGNLLWLWHIKKTVFLSKKCIRFWCSFVLTYTLFVIIYCRLLPNSYTHWPNCSMYKFAIINFHAKQETEL